MKKLIALLLCLALSLAACAEAGIEDTVPTQEPGATEDPALSGETMPTEESRETASNGDLILRRSGQVVDEPWPELTQEQSADGYVRLANYTHIRYTNEDGTGPADLWFYVPEFTLESADAKDCNQEIRELCGPIITSALEYDLPADEARTAIQFQAWHWAGVVSLSVEYEGYNDAPERIYNLDTQTGELLDNLEVARRAGIREEDYWETLERTALQARDSFLDEGPPVGYTVENRNQTRSRENLENMKLYMGEGGRLMTTVKVYTDVGAGEYLLTAPVEIMSEGWSGVLLGLWEDTLKDKQNADQYVTLSHQEEKTYTTEDGEEILCTYRLPEVLLNGEDARAYTEELQWTLSNQWRGGVYASSFDTEICCSVKSADYRSWVWEDTLTVLVTMEVYDMPYVWCSVATFDLNSGQRLDNAAVFMRLTGQETAASMEEIMAENLGVYFDQVHAQGEDDERIAYRRERTVTWTGMGMTAPVLYPGPDGTMMALATIDSPLAHRSFMALVPMDELALLELSVTPGEDAQLEELVAVYDHSIVKFTNDQKETYYIEMTIPQLNIDTPDGRACNWELQDILGRSKAERNEAFAVGPVTKLWDIGYDAWIWAGTLTLVAWDRANEEQCDYYIYVFDLKTGERLDNIQVAALLGLTEERAKEKAKNAMLEAFERKFFGDKETAYLNQKNATLNEDNMARITLYPSAEGKLMVLCRIVVYPEGVGQPCWYLLPTE